MQLVFSKIDLGIIFSEDIREYLTDLYKGVGKKKVCLMPADVALDKHRWIGLLHEFVGLAGQQKTADFNLDDICFSVQVYNLSLFFWGDNIWAYDF